MSLDKTTNKKLRERFERNYGSLKDLVMNEYMDVEDAEELEKSIWQFIESAIKEAVEAERERIKEVVKNAQPTFFTQGEGLSDKEQQLMDDAVYETRVEIYEQAFENKNPLTLADVLKSELSQQKGEDGR